jgi:hypothetical protein
MIPIQKRASEEDAYLLRRGQRRFWLLVGIHVDGVWGVVKGVVVFGCNGVKKYHGAGWLVAGSDMSVKVVVN